MDAVLAAQSGDGFDEASGLLNHAGGALDDGFENDAGGRGGVSVEIRCGARCVAHADRRRRDVALIFSR